MIFAISLLLALAGQTKKCYNRRTLVTTAQKSLVYRQVFAVTKTFEPIFKIDEEFNLKKIAIVLLPALATLSLVLFLFRDKLQVPTTTSTRDPKALIPEVSEAVKTPVNVVEFKGSTNDDKAFVRVPKNDAKKVETKHKPKQDYGIKSPIDTFVETAGIDTEFQMMDSMFEEQLAVLLQDPSINPADREALAEELTQVLKGEVLLEQYKEGLATFSSEELSELRDVYNDDVVKQLKANQMAMFSDMNSETFMASQSSYAKEPEDRKKALANYAERTGVNKQIDSMANMMSNVPGLDGETLEFAQRNDFTEAMRQAAYDNLATITKDMTTEQVDHGATMMSKPSALREAKLREEISMKVSQKAVATAEARTKSMTQ